MKPKMWIALLALYVGWGTTYLAISYAIKTIPPFFMSGTRFLVAGLILYGWRRLAGDPTPTRTQWKNSVIIGIFLLVGGIGGVGIAERYVPSGIAALLIAVIPMWVILIETLPPFKTRPHRFAMLGILVGLVGLFILVDPIRPGGNHTGYSLVGVVVLLLAALSWSFGSVISHRADLPKSALLSTGIQLLAGSAGSYLVGLFTGEAGSLDISQISTNSLAGLAYLIVVGSLVGFVCYSWLLQVAPTSLVVTYTYVNPLVAIILGSLIAGEVVTPRILIAAPLILSAVVLVHANRLGPAAIQHPGVKLAESAGDD